MKLDRKKIKTVPQFLRAMNLLLSTPKRWTVFVFARKEAVPRASLRRDESGNGSDKLMFRAKASICDSYSKDAVCWCLLGAINGVVDGHKTRHLLELGMEARELMMNVAEASGWESVDAFNDAKGRTFKQIKAFLKKCIKKADQDAKGA